MLIIVHRHTQRLGMNLTYICYRMGVCVFVFVSVYLTYDLFQHFVECGQKKTKITDSPIFYYLLPFALLPHAAVCNTCYYYCVSAVLLVMFGGIFFYFHFNADEQQGKKEL
jgi:hypothetical protein